MSNFMSQYITHCPFTPSSGSNPALSWGNKKHLKIFSRLISRPNGLQFTLTWQTQQTNIFATNENVYMKTFRNEQYKKASQTDLKATLWFHRELKQRWRKIWAAPVPPKTGDWRIQIVEICLCHFVVGKTAVWKDSGDGKNKRKQLKNKSSAVSYYSYVHAKIIYWGVCCT